MQPDLRAGEHWLAKRSPDERKRLGQWPTPWWVVRAVTERAVADLGSAPVILDPACGDGRFLLAAGKLRPDAVLVGVDVDPDAIEAAHANLAAAGLRAELRLADALAEPSPLPAADLVLSNPPFVRPQHLPVAQRTDLWARFTVASDKADLYACFVERIFATAPRRALVLPDTWLHLNSFAALRALVANAGPCDLYSLPSNAFVGARVLTVVLLSGAGAADRAGSLAETGWTETGPLARGEHAWSLDGALPELPGARLDSFVSLHMGVVCGDYPRYVHPEREHPLDQPTCRGRDVERWSLGPVREYVRYEPTDMLARKPYVAPKHAGVFAVPQKIVLAGTSGRSLRAAMDEEQRFPLDSCYVLLPKTPEVDLWAVLGFLLSDRVSAWYGARHRAARVKAVEVARVPIPSSGWGPVADAARAQDDARLNEAVDRAYARELHGTR